MASVELTVVGFSTVPKNLISTAIRDVTGSRFSHCWVRYYHPIYRMPVVVEADLNGIVEKPYEGYGTTNTIFHELVPPLGRDATIGLPLLGASLGEAYAIDSVVGRLWVYFWRWLGRKVRNPLADAKKQCCVENMLMYASAVDPSLANLDPEVESPETAYEAMLKAGWRDTIEPPKMKVRGL